MLIHPIFDFSGKDIESRNKNHVLFSVNNCNVSIFTDFYIIASPKPAVFGNCVTGCLCLLPVPQHHLRPSDAGLAAFSETYRLSSIVYRHNFCLRHKFANSAQSHFTGQIHRDHWRAFGEAIPLKDLTTRQLLPTLGYRGRQSHSTRPTKSKISEVKRAKSRVFKQGQIQSVNTDKATDFVLCKSAQYAIKVSGIRYQNAEIAGIRHSQTMQQECVTVVERKWCSNFLNPLPDDQATA